MHFPRWLLGVLLVCGLVACHAPGAAPATPGPRIAAGVDYEAIFRARTDSAQRRYTAADAAFMTGMIGHHAQAIVMAAQAPSHGANASVRVLAARIINAQRDEIALMQTWLHARGLPVPVVPAPAEGRAGEASMGDHGMAGHDMDDHARMPGMLTGAQLSQLSAARGADFDRLFLTLMIQHHRGAVVMVDQLFKTDGAGNDEAVFKFASDVQVDQTTEVARMERLLAAMSAAVSSP